MLNRISHFAGAAADTLRELKWIEYRGWNALSMREGTVELVVVPAIGGRLMSIRHEGVELAYVNDALAGRVPDWSVEQWRALCGEWNFPLWGGGKTWIAPESEWPDGAPQRDLDSGPYEVTGTWFDNRSMGIELLSPVCRQSGLQVRRRIALSARDGAWTTSHELSNRGESARSCAIWDVLMLRRPGRVETGIENGQQDWRVSVMPFLAKGPLGDVRDSGFVTGSNSHVATQCTDAVEFKLGINNSPGVMHVVFDLPEAKLTLSRRFPVLPEARYAHGSPLEIFNAPKLPYFEIESHGPLVVLRPGESTTLDVHEAVGGVEKLR
ncbi:hypothetical protein [Caballeronia sp. DA-9]|uniref:hypothetical protein n=1 Tax=Caballeronia sp. DA-9 TaxID=3436237 RepID=UPI003F661B36